MKRCNSYQLLKYRGVWGLKQNNKNNNEGYLTQRISHREEINVGGSKGRGH